MDHEVDPRARGRNAELLRRVENARQWIHQACSDSLRTESAVNRVRLDRRVDPRNEYVIESNARDVQLNLPRRFYQELPALANERYRACAFTDWRRNLSPLRNLRLDRENILAFMRPINPCAR